MPVCAKDYNEAIEGFQHEVTEEEIFDDICNINFKEPLIIQILESVLLNESFQKLLLILAPLVVLHWTLESFGLVQLWGLRACSLKKENV